MTDTNWADAKTELNTLVSKLRHVHGNLPSFHSDYLKGWDLCDAYTACSYLRSAIAALEPLAKSRNGATQ